MAFTYQDMGHAFHEYPYILRIFRNGWMDCTDTFNAVLCLYCCVTDKAWLITKRCLWLLQKLIRRKRISLAILCSFCNGWMDCKNFHAVFFFFAYIAA